MTDKTLTVDEAKIKKAVQNSLPLTVMTYTFPRDVEVYLEEVLEIFLKELGQEKIKDYLVYCLRELTVNAKKANTKRVYFESRGLDLSNPKDYAEGMRAFKADTLENIQYYLQKQKEKKYYIKISFYKQGAAIIFEIRNNVEMTKTEFLRVQDKLVKSRRFESFEDAMSGVLDSSEGAGLGLVILVLMLKKMGLSEDCFAISTSNGETLSRLVLPIDAIRIESLDTLTKEIVTRITELPHFPENILAIQRLLADPKSELVDIARNISVDPAMTADLLKLINSAQFMLPRRVNNLVDAVKLVGLRGIKNLLFSYGTQKIFENEHSTVEQKTLWDHSYRCAYYSYNLAKNFKSGNKALQDDAYVGGILHDMGKILFSAAHSDLIDKVKIFCDGKGIARSYFEELAGGMDHAEIGARVAEKWNFPEPLSAAVRFHHEPLRAPGAFKGVVYTVYLGNVFCEYENGCMQYDQIERDVLLSFGFQNEKQFAKTVEQFSHNFANEAKKQFEVNAVKR